MMLTETEQTACLPAVRQAVAHIFWDQSIVTVTDVRQYLKGVYSPEMIAKVLDYMRSQGELVSVTGPRTLLAYRTYRGVSNADC